MEIRLIKKINNSLTKSMESEAMDIIYSYALPFLSLSRKLTNPKRVRGCESVTHNKKSMEI